MKRKHKQNIILNILFWSPLIFCLLLAWTDTLRTDTPAGTDDPREADDRMREIKGAFVERLAIDHYFTASATSTYDATDTGKHIQVTFQAPLSSDPTTINADEARLYTKDVSSKAELHWIDEDENAIQLTTGGILNSCNLTGTQTVAGAKTFSDIVTFSDVVTLADSSQLASSAAPTADADLANKKYVDDQITAGADPTYSGGESHTFNGGLIIKIGQTNNISGHSTTTVTFGTAFPNSCIQAFAISRTATVEHFNVAVSSISAANMGIYNKDATAQASRWIAIGY